MKNLDKGTVVRTVLLFIALVNQTLIVFGKPVLPISEDQINTLADALYLAYPRFLPSSRRWSLGIKTTMSLTKESSKKKF